MSPAYFTVNIFLAVLVVISVTNSLPYFILLYTLLIFIGISTHFLDQFGYRSPLNFFGKFLIIILIFNTFSSLGYFTEKVHPILLDNQLHQIDLSLFGFSPVLWVAQNIRIPLLTEAFQISYFFYFPFCMLIVFLHYFARTEKHTDFAYFSLTFGLTLTYILYIVFPALGPRDGFDEPSLAQNLIIQYPAQLQGLFFTEPIRQWLNEMEKIKTDAFPSGHTLITLLALRLYFKFNKKLFFFMLPIGLSIIAATIFCRYHYVIDVIAGAGLFLLILLFDHKLFNHLKKLLYWISQIRSPFKTNRKNST